MENKEYFFSNEEKQDNFNLIGGTGPDGTDGPDGTGNDGNDSPGGPDGKTKTEDGDAKGKQADAAAKGEQDIEELQAKIKTLEAEKTKYEENINRLRTTLTTFNTHYQGITGIFKELEQSYKQMEIFLTTDALPEIVDSKSAIKANKTLVSQYQSSKVVKPNNSEQNPNQLKPSQLTQGERVGSGNNNEPKTNPVGAEEQTSGGGRKNKSKKRRGKRVSRSSKRISKRKGKK